MDKSYKAFIRTVQAKQRAYIRAEHKRMAKALQLLERYQAGMTALGLHSLDRFEIAGRVRELNHMEANIRQTHGDSPTMRWAFEDQSRERPAQ